MFVETYRSIVWQAILGAAKSVSSADRLPGLDDSRLRRFSPNYHRTIELLLDLQFRRERNAIATNPIRATLASENRQGVNNRPNALKNGIIRCEERVRSSIIRHADERGMIVSRIVFATYGPGACVNWESEIEMICLVTQHSRSAPVKVKFGIKASAMLASLALATVFVAGCTEETPPETKPQPLLRRRRSGEGRRHEAPAPRLRPPKPEEKKQ